MARRQRQSASASLIQGAGMVAKSQGFVNYAEAIKSANPGQGENFYIKEKERKEATKSRVNGYISNMKSNIDLDGLTAEQEGALRGFLMNERNIYANAANEIAKIDDASSPEYQYYVDIMNGVNRSFATLSEELKTYREAKSTYAEMHQADIYSNAASGDEIQMAASLYGLDPEVPALFSVGKGGHLQFEVNGQMQSYKDYKEPMMKDYKTMDALLQTTNTIYSNGQKLTNTKINQLGLQIEGMLANPETIKSLLSGDFSSSGIDLSHIAYDPNDVAGTRMQLRDALLDGLIQVANEGYREKESKKNPRGGGGSRRGGGGGAGGGGAASSNIYDGTGGLFKNSDDLDATYLQMREVEWGTMGGNTENTVVNVPGKANVQLRYVPNPAGQNAPGKWVVFTRSGSGGTFKPRRNADGGVDAFENSRDWYATATGQK